MILFVNIVLQDDFYEEMGNQQSLAGNILPSNCAQGRRQSLPQIGRYRRLSFDGSDSTTYCSSTGYMDDDCLSLQSIDEEDSEEFLNEVYDLENAVLMDDIKQVEKICDEKKINVNTQLNEKGETALILGVKLSRIDIVKVLLLTSGINRNSVNIHSFSPLDVALVTAFDNRLEPRQTVCWQIIECLLQVGAEPSNKDAMMYVIRTALKYCDEEFIYRLILLVKEFSNSSVLHDYILEKLHRYQPVYIESLDPFFVCCSEFTIKLLKNANGIQLCDIVNSMIYYLDSYWHCTEQKIAIFQKLVLYASAAGWDWTPQQMTYINRVCPFNLAKWCKSQQLYPVSLCHLARKSYRRSTKCLIPESMKGLPYTVPAPIQHYIMLKDIDELLAGKEFNMADIQL